MPPHDEHLGRRTLLRAALATPAVAAAPALLGAAPAHAAAPTTPSATGRAGGFDPASPRFTVAVVPDTQYLFVTDTTDPRPLAATYRYLLERRGEHNTAFMAHLGDVVENGGQDEVGPASEVFEILDGRLPYSVLAGNHDVAPDRDDQRGDTPWLRAFGPQRFAGRPTYRGSSPGGYNSYHVFPAGGREWLVFALDWRMTDVGFAWAQGVIDANPTLPIILTSHETTVADDAGQARLSTYGQRLWDTLVRTNDQVFLVLSGHYWPPGRTVLTNDAGHEVQLHLANYQDRFYGGGGMMRTYAFDLDRGTIDVETFAPWFLTQEPAERNELEEETRELTSPVDRFSVAVDFEERFAAFAPPVVAAARPASAVVSRETAAYWRFDAAGLAPGADGSAVPAGAVVRDLTGQGNDLAVRFLGGSGDGVLRRSEDHHEDQPSHASLSFDGGRQPARGAVLEAVASAPVNSETFERGYTIEVFLKLPDPFEGSHPFMGVLSWQGRASQAGKTVGYSPDEMTVSLNIAPEWFVQYNVYPAQQDASPTSWSHALTIGRWQHIAVVNDGAQTLMYVEGSKIVRNPRQRSTGIATLGKPFVIGATPFAEMFEQGFYGSIGDVRITARALRPSQFLAPYRDVD